MQTGDGVHNWAEDSYVTLPLGGGESEQQPTPENNLLVNKLEGNQD